jgi:hypothetical protein
MSTKVNPVIARETKKIAAAIFFVSCLLRLLCLIAYLAVYPILGGKNLYQNP